MAALPLLTAPAAATPPARFNLLVVPVDFDEEPGAYDAEDAQENWADPPIEYMDRMSVSACLGAPLSEEQLVTIDYVRASGTIVPQGVETYANGCFVSYLYTASDHPTRARAIWHGAAEFSRTISQDVNPTASDCCTSTAASGCAYPSIEECVCAVDDYCCLNHWDSICVGEVTSLGCGACHAACSTGAAQAREDDIEACVCARDTYCCTTAWDSLCVDEVDSFGCGTCGASMMSSAGSEIESTTAEEFATQRAGDAPPEPTLPPER